MARRPRDSLLLLGLSLLLCNRVGRGLRLGRSIWWGPPASFKLGSGAVLRGTAIALLLAIHGAMWLTTDMVEHQGAVALRGG
eukprot:5985519-Pyramimonas_sp.AAC.1